jgi:DNA-binding MarR family transcriptional regulator
MYIYHIIPESASLGHRIGPLIHVGSLDQGGPFWSGWGVNEYSRFGASFSLLNRSAQAYFARRLEPFGLRPAHQAYLLVIEPSEEPNQETLAHRLHVDKANVARSVGALEKLGYVTRRPDPADRRSRLVSLTSRGTEVRASVEDAMREWVHALQAAVAEGTWQTMLSGLEAMARAAEAYVSDDRGPGV